MKRSVYSLVLMDDVVREIDKAAYSMNTSRSNLINQILAEYVSCPTPEQRTRDIFDQVTQLILGVDSGEHTFQIQQQPSDALLSLKSALRFKYNPTIKYNVELYRGSDQVFGELRVSSRTQSRQLLEYLEDFYTRFAHLELECRQYYSQASRQLEFQIEGGKFTRKFIMPSGSALTNQQLGSAIAWYIQMFDRMINLYFDRLSLQSDPSGEMRNLYRNYLETAQWII